VAEPRNPNQVVGRWIDYWNTVDREGTRRPWRLAVDGVLL